MESLRKTREDIRGNLKIIRGTTEKPKGEPGGSPRVNQGRSKENPGITQTKPKKTLRNNARKTKLTRESRGNTKGKTYGKPDLGEAWAKLGRNLEWL